MQWLVSGYKKVKVRETTFDQLTAWEREQNDIEEKIKELQ